MIEMHRSYSFSDYFSMGKPVKEILNEFGYDFCFEKLNLPVIENAHLSLEHLKAQFYKKLPHIFLNSEAAKREFLIAPLLFELLDYIDFDINVEYPLYINENLKGNLDYLLQSQQHFLVLEAKNADLERGFTQLAVELIALDHFLPQNTNPLFGAITVGDVWRFGKLDRLTKTIYKDIDAFLVPSQLEQLFAVLLGILK